MLFLVDLEKREREKKKKKKAENSRGRRWNLISIRVRGAEKREGCNRQS